MTETATHLAEERRAHRAGRQAEKVRDFARARAEYQKALDARQAARRSDPGYTDPAWGGDLTAIHSQKDFDRDLGRRLKLPEGVDEPASYSEPAQNVSSSLQQVDADLEKHYRQKLGEALNPVFQVDLNDLAAAVRPPDEWRVVEEGKIQCANCHHGADAHDGKGACIAKTFKFERPGQFDFCDCPGYVADVCRHAFESLSASLRKCVGCGERQQLFPKMKPEATMAYQQLEKEAKARS